MKYHRLDNESPLIPESLEMQQQSNIQDTSVEFSVNLHIVKKLIHPFCKVIQMDFTVEQS